MKYPILAFAAVAGLALFGPSLSGVVLSGPASTRGATTIVAAPTFSAPDLAPVPENIPVALLVDLSSGQTLYSRAPDTRFVPASVTKVMSAYTAFKLIGEGKLSPDTLLQVSQEIDDKWSGEGSSMFLKAGDRVTVGQLILGVTTVSGNDAAVMLGTTSTGSLDNWLALMNRNAAELGMHNTHFGTPNGWMDEGHTYTSARDLTLLADALTTRYGALYHRYFGHRRMSYNNIAQVNHDPVTGIVDGADGIKTGYTRQAGYNVLGSAQRGDRRLVVVIAGAPTGTDRNRTARALLEWGFAAFQSRQLLPGDAPVGVARVQDGAARHVGLRTAVPVLASVPRGQVLQKPALDVRYSGPLEAPIRAGQPVATLHVTIPGELPNDVPLLATTAVAKANWLQRLRNGLLGLFG